MELLALLLVMGLAGLVALFVLRNQQAGYKAHVKQLDKQPAKPKRQLVVGKWTREEVAKHTSMDDLWLIIQNKDTKEHRVYDLTDYVDEHPGGTSIMNNAGADATAGFHGPQHPATVFELIKDFCIGTLVDP